MSLAKRYFFTKKYYNRINGYQDRKVQFRHEFTPLQNRIIRQLIIGGDHSWQQIAQLLSSMFRSTVGMKEVQDHYTNYLQDVIEDDDEIDLLGHDNDQNAIIRLLQKHHCNFKRVTRQLVNMRNKDFDQSKDLMIMMIMKVLKFWIQNVNNPIYQKKCTEAPFVFLNKQLQRFANLIMSFMYDSDSTMQKIRERILQSLIKIRLKVGIMAFKRPFNHTLIKLVDFTHRDNLIFYEYILFLRNHDKGGGFVALQYIDGCYKKVLKVQDTSKLVKRAKGQEQNPFEHLFNSDWHVGQDPQAPKLQAISRYNLDRRQEDFCNFMRQNTTKKSMNPLLSSNKPGMFIQNLSLQKRQQILPLPGATKQQDMSERIKQQVREKVAQRILNRQGIYMQGPTWKRY